MSVSPYSPYSPYVADDDSEDNEKADEESDDAIFAPCGCGRTFWVSFALCLCCTFTILLMVSCVAGYCVVSMQFNDDYWHDPSVTPPEFPRYSGCNGCSVGTKTDAEIAACAQPCFDLKLVQDWEAFNEAHDWKLVYFPSRAGPAKQSVVNISAWWLPADRSRLPAGMGDYRLVLLHGVASNNNHCGVQMTAFLLRTMGFSVLAPTLRNWGLSGKSATPDIVSWGWDYQYDLLGAWDYAVNDPDMALGGKVPDSHVGLIGFSMGGFVAQIAFGLEPRVPAAYIFSGPHGGLENMVNTYVSYVLGPLSPLVAKPVYWFASLWAGVDLAYELPRKTITDCAPRNPARPVGISNAVNDKSVPIAETGKLLIALGSHPECYDVEQVNTPHEDCNGGNHHVSMWQHTDRMRERLCTFWSAAFSRNASYCGLEELPLYSGSERFLPNRVWYDYTCSSGR